MNASQKLLELLAEHRLHPGAMIGNNFIECPACRFHAHVHDGASGTYLIQHWLPGDPEKRIYLEPQTIGQVADSLRNALQFQVVVVHDNAIEAYYNLKPERAFTLDQLKRKVESMLPDGYKITNVSVDLDRSAMLWITTF